LRNSSGNISGQLKITGTTDAPAVRGDVHFNKVGFNVAMLNSYFRMPQESITFNDEGIRLMILRWLIQPEQSHCQWQRLYQNLY